MNGKRIMFLVGFCIIALLGITERRHAQAVRREKVARALVEMGLADTSEIDDDNPSADQANIYRHYLKPSSGQQANVDSLSFKATQYLQRNTSWLGAIPPRLLFFAAAFALISIGLIGWLLNP